MTRNDPQLTDREKRLLRRLADRKSDAEIAAQIGGTAAQIAVQRERLLARLGIVSQSNLEKAVSSVAVSPNQDQVMKEYQHSF
jgi:DNA-binding CsgD family transcriptional regulator